jgi:pSer/pThr/pTyr-binding forkhead associated (FHA) protein
MSGSVRIEVVAGNAAGTWLDVTHEHELLIGRHADGLGRLGDDEEISRYHARVSLDAGELCAVEDLGSTNGTFVNGSRISGPQTLKQGDTIELGGSALVVRELPAPEAADPSGDPPTEAEGQATTERAAPAAATPEPEPKVPQPAPEPEREAEPTPPAAVPRLSLRLEIDFATNEALISLGEGAEPMRIVLESGAWRIA